MPNSRHPAYFCACSVLGRPRMLWGLTGPWGGLAELLQPRLHRLRRALAGCYLEEKSNPDAALNNSLVPGPSSSRR